MNLNRECKTQIAKERVREKKNEGLKGKENEKMRGCTSGTDRAQRRERNVWDCSVTGRWRAHNKRRRGKEVMQTAEAGTLGTEIYCSHMRPRLSAGH